jgi:hypothetical protein
MAGIKKSLMLLVWRFQQINSMILIIGLSLTLTLQSYQYVSWRFVELGIPARLDWLIMLIIFIIIFSCAIIVGIIYDSIMKLWIQQSVVMVERNPFAKEKIAAKGIVNRKYFFIPLMEKLNLKNEVKFSNKWIERNLEEDPILRKDVYRVINWINKYKLKPEDKRWLEDVEKILKKNYAPKAEDIIKK